jgi:hypothetical protein
MHHAAIPARNPRAIRKTGPWLALAAAAALVAGCGQPVSDPEARIREALAEAELAAESGDYEVLAARVARDYADRAGRDRRALLLTVRGLLMRYPRLELVVTVREIQVLSPQLARVRLEVLAAGMGSAGLAADAFPLELSLRDEGGGWKVTRAEWGRDSGGGI